MEWHDCRGGRRRKRRRIRGGHAGRVEDDMHRGMWGVDKAWGSQRRGGCCVIRKMGRMGMGEEGKGEEVLEAVSLKGLLEVNVEVEEED